MSPAASAPLSWRREAAWRFLVQSWREEAPYQIHASRTPDFTESRPTSNEVFSAMIILELLQGLPLEPRVREGLVRFIRPHQDADGVIGMFTNGTLPTDVDSTGMWLSVLRRAGELEPGQVQRAAARILANTGEEGILEVYLDAPPARRGRVDPSASANALYFLHQLGRGEEARRTEDHLLEVLEQEDLDDYFQRKVPYYPSADIFLHFLARLAFSFPRLASRFGEPLRRRLRERLGREAGPLDLATRLIAARRAELPAPEEETRLVALQREDGAWPKDVFFKYGFQEQGTLRYLGSEALTTAFALRALEQAPFPAPHPP